MAVLMLSMAKIVSSLAFTVEQVQDDLLDVCSSFLFFSARGDLSKSQFSQFCVFPRKYLEKMAPKL